jgi:hypothetical protein
MSILALTSNTLVTAASGQIEYNGQFFGTDSAASRAQLQRITQGTSITLTNQTAPEFTAIPSWAKRITLNMSGLSTNSTGTPIIQLGTGGTPTYTTSGYLSSVSILGASTVVTGNLTSGFGLSASHAAAYLIGGNIVLTNVTGNTWACSGLSGLSNTTGTILTGGSIALGAALTAVRFYIDGTQLFDAGSINILYEG